MHLFRQRLELHIAGIRIQVKNLETVWELRNRWVILILFIKTINFLFQLHKEVMHPPTVYFTVYIRIPAPSPTIKWNLRVLLGHNSQALLFISKLEFVSSTSYWLLKTELTVMMFSAGLTMETLSVNNINTKTFQWPAGRQRNHITNSALPAYEYSQNKFGQHWPKKDFWIANLKVW